MIYPQDLPQADGSVKPVWVMAYRAGGRRWWIAIRPRMGPTRPPVGPYSRFTRRPKAGQLGGKGIAFRHLRRRHLGRCDDRHHLRFRELHARQPESPGRHHSFDRHVAELHLGRRRRGPINLLVYLIIGVFFAGLMVGRTPEYLGKKVEAREMKLASLAMLAHPLLILIPTGRFVATDWGIKSQNNQAAHGFSEVLYEFTSASANNGSGFEGLNDNFVCSMKHPADAESPWDIAWGLVMLWDDLCR